MAIVVSSAVFRLEGKSPPETIRQAAEFAGGLDPSRLISISQSSEPGGVLVVVWFWIEPTERSNADTLAKINL